MNNEPVAWMVDGEVYLLNEIDGEELNAIPLYDHPADLTDEEIMAEWEESKDEVDFARAILRKAQEK